MNSASFVISGRKAKQDAAQARRENPLRQGQPEQKHACDPGGPSGTPLGIRGPSKNRPAAERAAKVERFLHAGPAKETAGSRPKRPAFKTVLHATPVEQCTSIEKGAPV
ncbi:MAG: hypothetical protein JKY61_11840 [Planctomycetes bacterium]|nr:hypothetical protein [Planctomycetota bacterium]